ncbi:hypothetical protein IWQ60_001555 [Tieghemiomyces parasiticus]|uniref:Pre-mRNA-splicing factor 38 n=1 Tax=Tieghemiomyces parasiticus TaxID=78921 RepID=A0A9W8AGI4_9FUNG|nr:hypothetical protein IWQ60_001555 [Tieghemiomyces parasiticus]
MQPGTDLADAPPPTKSEANTLETWGNETTMNLNNIIYQNIHMSNYFKSLYAYKTFNEVVEEAKRQDPFVKGTTVSSAFCLLFKMWTQRLTVKQLNRLLTFPDSAYVRGLGLLYLRYVCKPANLWGWYEPYLDDDEVLTLQGGPNTKTSTIGKLCHILLTELKFNGTLLPRIPVPIARKIQENLDQRRRGSRSGSRGTGRDPPSRRSRSPADRYAARHDHREHRGRQRSRSPTRYSGGRGHPRRSPSRDRYGRHRGRGERDDDRSRDLYHRTRDEFDRPSRRRRHHSRSRSASRDRYRRSSHDNDRHRGHQTPSRDADRHRRPSSAGSEDGQL